MAKYVARIEGLKELDKALSELPKATSRNVLIRALTNAGEPIAEAARGKVQVRTGQLRDSIVVSARLKNKVGAAEYAAVLRAGGTKADAVSALRNARREGGGSSAEVYVGPGALPHAHLIEFGWSGYGPWPYLRPAWDAEKDNALSSVKGELATQIEKARARLARKAEREAAKMLAGK